MDADQSRPLTQRDPRHVIQLDDYGSIQQADTLPLIQRAGSSDDSESTEPSRKNPHTHKSTESMEGSEYTGLYQPEGHKQQADVSMLQVRGSERYQWEEDLCFKDRIRKIDFVLVEEHKFEKGNSFGKSEQDHLRHNEWRERFKARLTEAGIQLEEEMIEGTKSSVNYVKVHVPWEVMCFYAEDLQLRAPLQINPTRADNWSQGIFKFLRIKRNPMHLDVPNQPPHYYTSAFKRAKVSKFLGSGHEMTFFAARDRQRVAYEILRRTAYGQKERAEVGIDRLVEKNVFVAAFPLHDGDYEEPGQWEDERSLNSRQILKKYWAGWGRWFRYQPLSHIREYFGEKIAIYFAWLGFYTAWLLPASIVGIIVTIFGIAFGPDTAALEACSSGKDYNMCPFCQDCPTWYLSDKCTWFRIASYIDNPGTVFFAIFMSFWAVSFLEYWKRTSAVLSYEWDCTDIVEEEEQPRPAFAEKCVEYDFNPVTGIKEPVFPKKKRLNRMITGLGILFLMVVVVIIFIVAVIFYRVMIPFVLGIKKDKNASTKEMVQSTFSLVSSSLLNLIVIMVMGKIYEKLAVKINEWEMHRTQSEFEDQLVFKVFVFQFVNFYSAIIYVGFFKGKFAGIPGHYNTFFGLRQEECQTGSCFTELAQQCAFIMIGKQIINNVQEVVIPKLKSAFHRWRSGQGSDQETRKPWEKDYAMIENEGLFAEYLEMVIQFGFITIFVAAFPLAPLFALLNNWIEIRLDAQKFVCETRRPVAERCKNIGVWFTILETLAQLSVVSNAFLIAFTSSFLPKQLYQYTYDSNLVGYTNFSLAVSPENSVSEAPCRYESFRDNQGEHTPFYWKLLCLRLLFVILFEDKELDVKIDVASSINRIERFNSFDPNYALERRIFHICKLIDLLVPDIPQSIDFKVKRERYLARQALTDAESLPMRANERDDERDTKQTTEPT